MSWLQSNASLLEYRKLIGLTDKQFEGLVVLVEAAEGHSVAVQVQSESETSLLTTLRLHLLHLRLALLHNLYQPRVLR